MRDTRDANQTLRDTCIEVHRQFRKVQKINAVLSGECTRLRRELAEIRAKSQASNEKTTTPNP